MAKSKSFFGLRTGSTKSLTFSVYRGTQVTKDRVTRVANPRTIAQMQQRAKVPLVAAARVALAGLVDHSFEGVPYGQASLQKFSSLNLANGALNVASYPPNGVSNMGCADFIVSQGSLVNPFVNDDAGIFGAGEISLPNFARSEDVFPQRIPKGTKGSTVLYFVNKALAHNPSWKINSQLTSLCIANQFNYVINEQGGGSLNRSVPLFTPFIQRLVFPDTYPSGEQDFYSLTDYHDDNDYWTLSTDYPENDVDLEGPNGESLRFQFDHDLKKCTVAMTPGSVGKTIVASCLIFSQLDGMNWKRSNSRIAIDFEGNLKSITPFTFSDWLQAYSKTIVSSKYLNTGNAATGISGQNG